MMDVVLFIFKITLFSIIIYMRKRGVVIDNSFNYLISYNDCISLY